MAFIKSGAPQGKKQAPMPGPDAAYSGGEDRWREPSKSATTFSSLKSRQMVVDRVKREIWASVLEINDAIALAKAGNFNAAKALFDFAGCMRSPQTKPRARPVHRAGRAPGD